MMLPEIGHFALILGLSLSVLLGTIPFIGASLNNTLMMRLAKPLASGQFLFIFIKDK